MQVEIDGVPVYSRVLNDVLFSHPIPAATTRYAIRRDGRAEEQRSSGVWIATAAGSTAAIHSAGGKILPITSQRLQFVVREPYEKRGVRYRVLRERSRPASGSRSSATCAAAGCTSTGRASSGRSRSAPCCA